MTNLSLIRISENFFNSLFLVFSTFSCGIAIGLLVFGLTMTLSVSRAFLLVIISSITASFIRCIYLEPEDERSCMYSSENMQQMISVPFQFRGPVIDISSNDPHIHIPCQQVNCPFYAQQNAPSQPSMDYQVDQILSPSSQVSTNQPSIPQPPSVSQISQTENTPEGILPYTPIHENSDIISAHSRRTEDTTSTNKKRVITDYLIQINVDFTRNLIYFVELYADTIQIKHFGEVISRSLSLPLPSEERLRLLNDEMYIVFSNRIQFCDEPCNAPQFVIYKELQEPPIASLCLHEDYLVVHELRRHISGQNLTVESTREGQQDFKTIYSGMIKANVRVRDYKDRIFRITIE